ncbi:MAG: tetratricopeptide repeat protein [Deltaproteobacteria bacterium]|nr:tetratricopeptide repeat protein [Deltaproteobacteria bacterium]
MKKLFFVVFMLAIVGSAYAQELNPTVKFNFLRGRDAFLKSDYQTALKELKAYIDVDGTNHHALNLLAQTYQNLNRLKDAEATYEKAIEAAPADTFAPIYSLNLGVLLFDQKKYDQALPHLTKAANKLAPFPKPFNEKKGLAYYYKAFIHYEREQWQDAKLNFEKANYYSSELKQGASFYLAICDYKLGNMSAAKDGFKFAEKLNTSRALTEYSQKFLETLKSVKKPSGFGLTTGFQAMYDTNVFLEPKEHRSHSTEPDEKGEAVGWILEPNYRSSFWGGNAVGKYNFSVGRQIESKHHRYDSYSHKLSGAFTKNVGTQGKDKISFDSAFGYLAGAAHRRINWSISQDVVYGIEWNPLLSTNFQLSGSYADFPSPESGNPADDRDVATVMLGGNGAWYMADQRVKINLGGGATQAVAEGSTYDATGFFGSLGLNFPFIAKSYIDLTGRLNYDKLTHDRDVTTRTATFGIFRNWSNHVSSSVGVSHIISKSMNEDKPSLDALAYTRDLVMLNLFYQL